MDSNVKKQLEIFACKARIGTIEGVYSAKAGHPGGSLSICDLLAYLYNCEMKINPSDPKWDGRDRLVLSKGHAAPALYAALALKGYFPVEDLKTLRKSDSYLQGHPNMNKIPGIDMSTGSLGQGISAAVGMALGAKLDGKDFRVYAILGDGEIEEGEVWEAAMLAGNRQLDNLVAFVDYNGLQIDGTIEEVNSACPIADKFAAFNWNVVTIDGHNLEEIEAALNTAHNTKGKPTCVVMKTVKGKGVSYMENSVGWHGKAPNDEEYKIAMDELNTQLRELEA